MSAFESQNRIVARDDRFVHGTMENTVIEFLFVFLDHELTGCAETGGARLNYGSESKGKVYWEIFDFVVDVELFEYLIVIEELRDVSYAAGEQCQ